MKTIRLALVVLGLLLVSGSIPAGVEIEIADGTDFSTYQTYSWDKGISAARPEAEKWITDAVDAQLRSAGLKKIDGDADLIVSTDAYAEALASGDVVDPGYWGSPDDFGMPTVNVSDFRKGTLAIHLRDRSEDKVVWSAVATTTLKNATDKKIRETVDRLTKKMFKKFPRR
jgi:hypothetical protein